MHLVQPTTTGDAQCLGDGQGGLEPFSPVYPGYAMSVRVSGGFTPLFVPIDVAFPARLVKGPLEPLRNEIGAHRQLDPAEHTGFLGREKREKRAGEAGT